MGKGCRVRICWNFRASRGLTMLKHTCREMTRQVCLWQVCLCREMTSLLDNTAGFRCDLTSPSPAKSTAKTKNTAKLTTTLLASPDDAFVGFHTPKR